MSNKDLLKQAIAEAKTIREAAIANAKEALEETLTPHLKEMLAQKLQEMDNEDEDEFDPSHDIEDAQQNTERGLYEEEEEEETEEGEEEGEEEELEIEDMSVEDLKDLIRDIVAQETGNEEGEEGPEEEDMTSMDGDSEEIDINELLAELAEMDEQGNTSMRQPSDSAAAGLDNLISMVKSIKSPEAIAKLKAFIKGLPAGAGAAMRSEGADEVEEGLGDAIKGAAGKVGAAVKGAVGTGGKFDQWIDRSKSKIDKVVPPHPYVKQQAMNKESVELNEALKAVKILRNQLQEVNLLNAKLLYVNKVFKSNNLSEGQKVNVIAAFDKAETVKEVKLVFETVSKNVVTKPAAIKEHRSFASKATGTATTTAPKEILSEVSEQVQRWQKLAGIIKS